ncbi:type 2 glycerol-3-phosphate oxidase [Spiroplasma melliferum]|uniref:Glycerol-3-phosphate dehydrogenase n=2 Tax=Spiroplasma melliferum TaxID=2134 RepID=A0AAI9T3L6_SPIME|nr:type 2 glycerol-3-phosphate oxidase [Spiroplasma melliferum]KAI92626.1 glycerol-3-phosphate dehydrogenase [Spiroplasma melliferum KC3]QCO24220.1 glycerol-3-phosphate dehydrogenase [Spiroplasma melliferum]
MGNKPTYDVCIIGGGVIGAAISRELSRYQLKTITIEKNKKVAMETSAGNSGVIHGGFDPTPGKLTAKLNIEGHKLYQTIFKELNIPHQQVNSLVIAFTAEEQEHLQMLYERGITNHVNPKDLRLIDQAEVKTLEPNISNQVLSALLCTSSWVVDPVILTKSFFSNSIKNHQELVLDHLVTNIKYHPEQSHFEITSLHHNQTITYFAKYLINAAGHYCDILAAQAGYPDYELVTKRGEYRVLEKSEGNLVNNIIFMVPTIHGKGVIVAPMLDGHLLVGPTAEDNVPKAETRLVTTAMYEKIGQIGVKIIPNLKMEKTCQTFAGSRPIEPLSKDFYLKPAHDNPKFINVAGTKSPGLSSAPAIAKYICHLLSDAGCQLVKNPDFDPIQLEIIPTI